MIRIIWLVLSFAAAVILAAPLYDFLVGWAANNVAYGVFGPSALAALKADFLVRSFGYVATGALILTVTGFLLVALVEGTMIAIATRRVRQAHEDAGVNASFTVSRIQMAFAPAPFLEALAARFAAHTTSVLRESRHLLTGSEGNYEILQSSLPANTHFSRRQLVDDRLALWLFGPLPWFLWGLGVVGTALILTRLNATTDSTAVWGSAALILALLGLAAVLAYAVTRSILSWRRLQADRFCETLDELLNFQPLSRQLQEMLNASHVHARTVEAAVQGVTSTIERRSELEAASISDSITTSTAQLGHVIKADIVTALKEPMSQMTMATMRLSEDQSAQVQQMLRSTLKAFLNEVDSLVGKQIRDTTGVIKEAHELSQKLERNINEAFKSASRYSKAQSSELAEALAVHTRSFADTAADFKTAVSGSHALKDSLGPILEDIRQNQEKLVSALDNQTAASGIVGRAAGDIAGAAVSITAILDGLKAATEQLRASREGGLAPLPPSGNTAATAAPTPAAVRSNSPHLNEDFQKLKSLVGGGDLPEL